jgi:ferredoxin
MDITVDVQRCQGHARCNLIAPDVFDLDDEGTAVVVGRPDAAEAHRADIASAVLNCPEGAISAR